MESGQQGDGLPNTDADAPIQEQVNTSIEQVAQVGQLLAELDIVRADHGEEEDYVVARAVHLPNASGVLENESWGGNNPRALLEIYIRGGALKGKLAAGGRIWLGIEAI